MAAKKNTAVSNKEISALQQQLKKLERENMELKNELSKDSGVKKTHSGFLRKSGVVFFVTLSIVTFMLFNVSSWIKNTVLDTDTFVTTMQPLIAEPAVQKTIQDEVTKNLFESVDVEQALQNALPEDIAFLSAPLSSQVEAYTASKVGQVLASQEVYDLWGRTLEVVHGKVVGYIENENADGVISVNDVYASVSEKVSDDRKISFLFNRQLPDKVGTITLAEVSWLPEARSYAQVMNVTPIVFLLTSTVSFLIAIGLSLKKRRTTIVTLVLVIIMMLSTLGALSLGNWQLGNSVQAKYVDTAQAVFTTITTPLENRTLGYAALFGAILLVMVLTSGAGFIKKSRQYVDAKLKDIASSILPAVSVPTWLQTFSNYISVIAWTVFIVLFIVIGVRIPPEYNEVKAALLWSSLAVLVLYLAHVCIRALNRKK